MEKIINFQAGSGKSFMYSLNQLISMKQAGFNSISYVRIGEELHSTDMSGPDLVRSAKYALINSHSEMGIFLDLRLVGGKKEVDRILKKYFAPDMLSVSSLCSVETVRYIRRLLPMTKLVMVGMLPDITDQESVLRFDLLPEERMLLEYKAFKRLYAQEKEVNPEPFDLIMCSSRQARYLQDNIDSCELMVVGRTPENNNSGYQLITMGQLIEIHKSKTGVLV